jgi:hypothetical protein
MLSFDAWRACRLVVDTGLHAFGWSRRRAIEFMLAHTALALNNIENEVDRYIAWPGQATAYKTGQLEIFRLARGGAAAARRGLRHQALPRCRAGPWRRLARHAGRDRRRALTSHGISSADTSA